MFGYDYDRNLLEHFVHLLIGNSRRDEMFVVTIEQPVCVPRQGGGCRTGGQRFLLQQLFVQIHGRHISCGFAALGFHDPHPHGWGCSCVSSRNPRTMEKVKLTETFVICWISSYTMAAFR